MLQCLIGTNRHTELLAGLGVLERLGIQHTHDAHGLCRECNDRLVGQRIDHCKGTALFTQQCIGANRHVLERDVRHALAVHHCVAHLIDAGSCRVDDKQR